MATSIRLPVAFTEAQLDAAIREVQQGCRSGLCDVAATVVEAVALRAKAQAIAKVLGLSLDKLDWRVALFTRGVRDEGLVTHVVLSDFGVSVQRLRPGNGDSSGRLVVTVADGRAW